MRLIIIISLVLFIFACANNDKSVNGGDDNVVITLQYPDDPLVEDIVSYKVMVTATDLATPLEKIATITPEIGAADTITGYSTEGADRIFTVYFYNQDGSPLFWGYHTTSVPTDNVMFDISIAQAASGAATRIKIFRDNLPWNSSALDNILSDFGLTLGWGDEQFQIISSSAIDTVTLSVGVDLVIIANDQSQEFYDNYHTSQEKIESFVRNGGVILWEACDLGWARGSIEEAGINLPGGIDMVSGYETRNYVTSSLWKMTEGLDSVITGNYASHEGFINLPDESLVYMIDGRYLPTLACYSYGIGWVIVTGQPLEYSYDHGSDSSTSAILPRIIEHVIGQD